MELVLLKTHIVLPHEYLLIKYVKAIYFDVTFIHCCYITAWEMLSRNTQIHTNALTHTFVKRLLIPGQRSWLPGWFVSKPSVTIWASTGISPFVQQHLNTHTHIHFHWNLPHTTADCVCVCWCLYIYCVYFWLLSTCSTLRQHDVFMFLKHHVKFCIPWIVI